jgi:murein DD-endopeptidase MepM/ murein hydrolase activator NlpD
VAFFALRHRLRFRLFAFAGILAVQIFAIAPMAYIATGTIADRQETNSNVQLASIGNSQISALYATYRVSTPQLHGLTGWQGVDITAGCGSPIYAPFGGTVTYAGLDGYNHVDNRGVVWEQATMLTIQGNNDLELTLLHGNYSV